MQQIKDGGLLACATRSASSADRSRRDGRGVYYDARARRVTACNLRPTPTCGSRAKSILGPSALQAHCGICACCTPKAYAATRAIERQERAARGCTHVARLQHLHARRRRGARRRDVAVVAALGLERLGRVRRRRPARARAHAGGARRGSRAPRAAADAAAAAAAQAETAAAASQETRGLGAQPPRAHPLEAAAAAAAKPRRDGTTRRARGAEARPSSADGAERGTREAERRPRAGRGHARADLADAEAERTRALRLVVGVLGRDRVERALANGGIGSLLRDGRTAYRPTGSMGPPSDAGRRSRSDDKPSVGNGVGQGALEAHAAKIHSKARRTATGRLRLKQSARELRCRRPSKPRAPTGTEFTLRKETSASP